MTLPKYKYLLTYRYSEIIYNLTYLFCQRFLDPYKDRRTIEQMIQAARSGKQNIIEGVGQSDTSKKGELKLLGVSKGSLEELLADYEDFLRQKKLSIWSKTDKRILQFRQIAFRLSHLSNLGHLGNLKENPVLPQNSQEAANFLLTLCHMETYLLSRQIASMENKFLQSGGYTENLFKKRLVERNKSPK